MKVSRLPASALGAALVAATSFAAPAPFSRSALDFVRDEIHVGINIGNTLDVPKGDEVEWGNVPVTRELIPAALSLALDSAAAVETVSPIDLSGIPASRAIAGTSAAGNPGAYANRGAIRAFDGSGIAADETCGTTANDAMFMFSANKSGSFPWYVQVDLGSTQRIDAVRLYNFNFAANGNAYTERGVRNFALYASTAGMWSTSAAGIRANYTPVLSNALARAPGTASYEGELFTLDTPVNARFVALVAFDDYDDTLSTMNYNGIAEIQLFGGDVEEPAPVAEPQFSVCCVGDSITEGMSQDAALQRWTYRLYIPDALAAFGYTNVAWKGSHVSSYSGSALPSEGWSGNTAAQIASKYEANAAGDRADFLLLHAGHNYDASDAANIPSVVAAVTNAHARIVAAARAQNPNVIVLEAKVITSGKLPKYQYIPALNDAIGALAADLDTAVSPVVAVDMADGWDYTTHCISDLVHPNEAGARRMADRWAAAIRAAIGTGPTDVLVEAESFSDKGGWVVDPQFVDVMGSPYLLAHGLGVPVADATTRVRFGETGPVRAWVRTRDWTPDYDGEKPGRFALAVDGVEFPNELGVAPPDWGWVDAGVVNVEAGLRTVSLVDRTGFEGRCDAVWFTSDTTAPAPPGEASALAAWRAEKRGESGPPADVVTADFVVVGGGIAGTCAAVAAADAGLSVAIVQDRPMLGGNASGEIRVKTQRAGDEGHWIVRAVRNTRENGNAYAATDDERRAAFVAGYPGVACHLGWRACGVVTNAERRIVAVDARHVETGARRRFVAPLYADCTGDGWLGFWAGAAFRVGRESRDEYGESLAPAAADAQTMGSSLLWSAAEGEGESSFPDVPWATKVSGSRAALKGDWTWEAGMEYDGRPEDTIYDAEALRDRLLRAIYGSFSNAKLNAANARQALAWVPYVAGKRESRRIMGDYVVRQSDVESARPFEDAIGVATWSIDLHYPADDSGYVAATKQIAVPRWWMPYRSLCCRDVPNLFLAGRCASYTHVAFGSSRVMHAGGQQGVAVGYAASLCRRHGCDPREIYRDPAKTAALQALVNKRGDNVWPDPTPERVVVSLVVDNDDASGVERSGDWSESSHSANRHGGSYLHNGRQASDDLWVRFTPDLPSNATYRVSLAWNGDASRGSAVPVEIVHAGGVETNLVDQTSSLAIWNKLGEWPFAAGTAGSVRILTAGQDGSYVIADAVRFEIVERDESGDTDANGIPDEWERRHFLRLTGTVPDADPDADGLPNVGEWLADTDPHDAASRFSMRGIAPAATARTITLSWPSVEGRTYTVLRAERLGEPFVPYRTGIPATPPENAIDLPSDDSDAAFYRIAIDVP